jgi:hypothetical protein
VLDGNVTSASQELVKAESNEDERIMQDARVERVRVNEDAKSRSVERVVHDTMALVE